MKTGVKVQENADLNDNKERVLWVDTFRGLLIFFVVFGHFISGENSFLETGYGYAHYLIYCVHMELFFMISAIVSGKKFTFRKLFFYFILPYAFFDFGCVVWYYLRGMPFAVYKNILFPSSLYWFILALGIVKLITTKSGYRFSMVIAGVLFVVEAFTPEKWWDFLALGRVALLLPAFLIGLKLKEHMDTIRKQKGICTLLGVISIGMELMLVKLKIVPIFWSTHDYQPDLKLYCLKLLYIIVFSTAVFVMFCAWIPDKKCFLTRWGRNSIIIYLIHPFIQEVMQEKLITYCGIYWAYWKPWMWIAIVIATILICEILALDIFEKFYRFMIGFAEKIWDRMIGKRIMK